MNTQPELTEESTDTAVADVLKSTYDLEQEKIQAFKKAPVEKFTISKENFDRLVLCGPKAFVVSSNVNAIQYVTARAAPTADTIDPAFEFCQTMFFGYEPDMLLTFNNGARYLYKFVSTGTRQSLVAADSVGSYFAKNIKGQYITYKVDSVIETSPEGVETEMIVFTLTK